MTIETFEHIARELRPLLQSIGHRFFADPSRADDVAQEVLMRLWLMRERVNVEQGVEPLAVRMAKNFCASPFACNCKWRGGLLLWHSSDFTDAEQCPDSSGSIVS